MRSAQDGPDKIDDVIDIIDPEGPQYTVIKHLQDPKMNIFVYTCPTRSKIKERMIYASSRLKVANMVYENMKIDKTIEATNPSDVVELLKDELVPVNTLPHVSQNSTPRFSRPKPPGRR